MRAPVSHRFVRLLVGAGPGGGAAPAGARRARPRGGRASSSSESARSRTSTRLNPYADAPRGRLRGLPADLQPARRLRARPRAGARLRRQVGARRRREVLDLQVPRRAEVVRRHAGHGPGRLLLVGPRRGGHRRRGVHRRRLPRPRPRRRRRHQGRVPRRHDDDRLHGGRVRPDPPDLPADHPEAHLGRARLHRDRRGEVRGAARRHRPVHARRVADQPVRPLRAQPRVLGHAGRRRRDRDRLLQERRHDGAGAQGGRDRLRPRPELRAAEGPRSPSRA